MSRDPYVGATCLDCGKRRAVRQDSLRKVRRCRPCALRLIAQGPRPWRRTGNWIPCAVCQREFWRFNYRPSRFCSQRCASEGKRKHAIVEMRCAHCAKPFLAAPTRHPKTQGPRKYCSLACRDAAYVGFYQGGPAALAGPRAGWSKVRRKFLRQNSFCWACGGEEKLVVHHLNRWRFTRDNRDLNLVTLCRAHHTAIHKATDRFDNALPRIRETIAWMVGAKLEESWHFIQGRRRSA